MAARRSLLFAILLAACHKSAPEPALPGPLRSAAAQRALAEPVGLPTAGYTQDIYLTGPLPADEPGSAFADIFPSTRGLETQPMAKVLLLDNGRARLALARIDAVFVTAVLTERVLQLVRDRSHVDLSGQLILDATHTHAAGSRFSRESLSPEALASEPAPARHVLAHGADTFSQEVTDRIAGSIADAIGDALASLRPARFGHASADNTTAAHDRRCENDWITGGPDLDSRVTVLRVEGQDGAPIAALFHYAMHGTVSGSSNRSLSIDAPGHAELAVERTFSSPMVAMYLQGNAGDSSPTGGGDTGSQAMDRVGADLAASVAQAWAAAGAQLQDSLVLQSLERQVPISYAGLGYKGNEFAHDGAVLCQYLYSPACPGAAIPPSQVICVGTALPGLGKSQTRVLAARIGDLALVTLSGEPVAAVGRALRQRVLAEGFADALVLGYAQDHDGYLLLDQDWLSGGYEPTITFWGWRYGSFLVEQSADVLHELVSGVALHKLLPEPKPVDATPLAFTPSPVSDSEPAPSLTTQPPAQVARLAPVRISFWGGDPALGAPEVRLQRDDGTGAFADVLVNGWIPVSSARGEVPLVHTATPSWHEDPHAAARAHRWDATYEPPIDLPIGNYRLHISGKAQVKGAAQPLELVTQPFAVQASGQLAFDGQLAVASSTLTIDLTPLYPARVPVFAAAPSPDWQLDGFRLVDPRYAAPFAPVEPGSAAVAATLTGPAGAQQLSLAPRHPEWPAGVASYAPGVGPGLHAAVAVPSGHFTLALAAGAFADALGNSTGAASFTVDVP